MFLPTFSGVFSLGRPRKTEPPYEPPPLEYSSAADLASKLLPGHFCSRCDGDGFKREPLFAVTEPEDVEFEAEPGYPAMVMVIVWARCTRVDWHFRWCELDRTYPDAE